MNKDKGASTIKHVPPLPSLLANPRRATPPVKALKVPEHQLVALEIVHDTVNTAVALDGIHALVLLSHSAVISTLGFEEGHAEAARLEDVDDFFDDFDGLAAGLASRHVGLEAGVGALRLGGDVDGPVVGRLGVAGLGDDTVGGESAGSEQVRIDAGVGVLGLRVHIRETAVLGDDGA